MHRDVEGTLRVDRVVGRLGAINVSAQSTRLFVEIQACGMPLRNPLDRL